MKNFVITGFLFAASFGVRAQQAGEKMPVNMEQAIQTGLKNRYDIQSKKYNLAVAASELGKTKKEWITDITAGGNVRYSPQLQATFVPGGFMSEQSMLIALGAKASAVLGLDINQTVFRPGIGTDIKLAKNNVALVQEKIRQDENTIREQISLSYLNVLLKDLQAKIAADGEKRYAEYLSVMEAKYKLGTVLENDYLKSKLDLDNATIETWKAVQNYSLAVTNLKYQMNVPAQTNLILTDTTLSADLYKIPASGKGDATGRSEIKQLLLQQNSAKLQTNRLRQYALPSVSLFGNLSRQFTYTSFDFSQSRWWSNFNFVGVKMSIPITGSLKYQNNIEEQKSRVAQADLDLKQKMKDVDFEIDNSYTELLNARQNLEAASSNYDLSRKIYENLYAQYGLGTRQYIEILETERSLKATEQNFVLATYQYLVATVNYQKAKGW